MIRDVSEGNQKIFKQTMKMKHLKNISENYKNFTLLCTMKMEANSPIFNANIKILQKEISDVIFIENNT